MKTKDMLAKVRSDALSKHVNIRDNIAKAESVESLLVVDESLTIILSAVDQCMEELKKTESQHIPDYLELISMLLTQLEKFKKNKITLDRMYWTNAAASTELVRRGTTVTTAPEGLLSIMAT